MLPKKLWWTCLAAMVLLAGCAGTPVDSTVSVSDVKQKAIAVLSVSHDIDAGDAAWAIFYLDSDRYPGRVVMKSLQESFVMTVKSDFKERRGHLYMLELEPGQHTIDGWQVYSAGARITSSTAPLQFDIRQGEVLYLGNLHAKLVVGRGTPVGRIANAAMPVVADQRDVDIAVAESRVPALKGKVRVALLSLGPFTSTSNTTRKMDAISIPVVPKK